ncbi:uncharacterized protein LOC119832500 [Zerene cesonia]|uniref:uncharacterized protein LOC119832500 n=1 Tax=Zerene cesonia TaxID=33412 RepID=UPI0018E5663E|nr:uncharacterized protein LOC119832500 [Zerene cesonia]
MNFGAFLIILFNINIYLAYGFKDIYTEHDNCSLCTLSFFRRKRALSEYTRWRSNPETTQAFIVKVLEDDVPLPTPRNQIVENVTIRHTPRQIVAVNIQPLKMAEDKMIVERATLRPSTVTPDLSKEYTRFVPPTTLTIARHEGDIVLDRVSPVIINDKIPPIKPKSKGNGDRHVQRDESPPSGPQFIQRSNTEVVRQYAPVATVLFTKQKTLGPLTPRTVDKFILYKTSRHPTRTSPLSDIIVPMRTPDFFNILTFDDDSDNLIKFDKAFPTRTTYKPIESLQHTSTNKLMIDEDDNAIETTIRTIDVQRRKGIVKKITDKEIDAYNMVLYGDEEGESTKKNLHESTDSYEDIEDKASRDSSVNNAKSGTSHGVEEYDNTTELLSHLEYDDDDDFKNGTTLTTRILQGLVDFELTTKSLKEEIKKNRTCNLIKLRQLSFNSPRTLHEITSQLKQWAEESPVAKWIDITAGNFTVMENPIHMMIVDDPTSGQIVSAKQTVMIIAGIQGRDHHSVAAAMYVLYQLIERSEAHADLLTKYRFWIIPVFNPDGYAYSMTFPHRREWMKNLKQSWASCKARDSCKACELYGVRCTIQPCYGVNLDRNFEYQWIPTEELRSEHPCGPLFAGPRQLSEAETRALTHYLHEQKTPLYTFIAFKEGDVLRQRASSAAAAAYSISGRPYVAGQTSEFLPLYAGGIEDWVDGHLGIDNTYTVMMFRPSDSHNSRIITERVVHEAYAAIDTLLLQSVEPLGPPPVTITRSRANIVSPLPFLLLFLSTRLLYFAAL